MTATQINLSEHILKQHAGVVYSGEYLKLRAQGKNFQNWMFSKKNMALFLYFPFSSQNHSDL